MMSMYLKSDKSYTGYIDLQCKPSSMEWCETELKVLVNILYIWKCFIMDLQHVSISPKGPMSIDPEMFL